MSTQPSLFDGGHVPTGSAEISPCGRYRYTLGRRIAPAHVGQVAHVTWVMLNPSTADADIDDATILKVLAFADSWGFAELRVVNLFAFRATDPAELIGHRVGVDVVGPGNDEAIRRATADALRVVVAWGACATLSTPNDRRFLADRIERVVGLLAGHELLCLGTTKDGHPRHPLYLAKNTKLVPWRAP